MFVLRVWWFLGATTLLFAFAPACRAQANRMNAPLVDHHQHLLSSAAAALINALDGPKAAQTTVPPDILDLLTRRAATWDDAQALAEMHAPNALVSIRSTTIQGATAVSTTLAKSFRSAYRFQVVASHVSGTTAQLSAYLVRGEGSGVSYFGVAALSLSKAPDGRWLFDSESLQFPGPRAYSPTGAADLVALMDAADVRRSVVLSMAYVFGTPLAPPQTDEQAKVRAENDWTATEAARFPDRLIPFCSLNPLKDYAISELERCVRQQRMRGLKLHFANSDVDLRRAEHVQHLCAVFAAANRLHVPIVAHVWRAGGNYGAADIRIFIDQVLPCAPNIVVQIGHMAGAGPGWTDEALKVFADAISAGDARTGNLYFDVATVADDQPPERLQILASRIRQIGVQRILYGSDAAFGGRKTANEEWGTFRGMVPLTDAEFRTIGDNVAPYLLNSR